MSSIDLVDVIDEYRSVAWDAYHSEKFGDELYFDIDDIHPDDVECYYPDIVDNSSHINIDYDDLYSPVCAFLVAIAVALLRARRGLETRISMRTRHRNIQISVKPGMTFVDIVRQIPGWR